MLKRRWVPCLLILKFKKKKKKKIYNNTKNSICVLDEKDL